MQRHISSKHSSHVFSPVFSAPNPTEKWQWFRFLHPLTCMVVGMTGSGKTVWVKRAQEVIHRKVWCNGNGSPLTWN